MLVCSSTPRTICYTGDGDKFVYRVREVFGGVATLHPYDGLSNYLERDIKHRAADILFPTPFCKIGKREEHRCVGLDSLVGREFARQAGNSVSNPGLVSSFYIFITQKIAARLSGRSLKGTYP